MPSPKKPCPGCGKPMSPRASQCRACKPAYERTAEHRDRMKAVLAGKEKPWLRGRKRPEVGKKISAAWTEEKREEARIRGLIAAENQEWLVKIAEALSGEANPNYQGKGKESPYGPGWGRKYRERIRARAKGICEKCGRKRSKLDLHHKDFRKDNHNPDNLMVICRSCHKLLHFANSEST